MPRKVITIYYNWITTFVDSYMQNRLNYASTIFQHIKNNQKNKLNRMTPNNYYTEKS